MDADCGVCLSTGDIDPAEFYSERMVRARKQHRCCECGDFINTGSEYEYVSGKWDGTFSDFRTCIDCRRIRTAFACGGSWEFTRLWESLRESSDYLNTGCVAKISTASAKQKFMDWLIEVRREEGRA